MRNRRYGRGFAGNSRKRPKPSYLPLILILCLSVGCGYATAKYVVDPVVNYVPQISEKAAEKQADKDSKKESKESSAAKETTKAVEDDVKVKNTGKLKGYAVQLGCYSDQASAEKARKEVNLEGLQVVEQSSMYKVIGKVCKTKEDARSALAGLPEGIKGFVTEVYE